MRFRSEPAVKLTAVGQGEPKKPERGDFMGSIAELLDILACPKCKGPLQYTGEALVCQACQLKYAVRDGIPVLLVEEAERLSGE